MDDDNQLDEPVYEECAEGPKRPVWPWVVIFTVLLSGALIFATDSGLIFTNKAIPEPYRVVQRTQFPIRRTRVDQYRDESKPRKKCVSTTKPFLLCFMFTCFSIVGLWNFRHGPYHWLGLVAFFVGLAGLAYGYGLFLDCASQQSQLFSNGCEGIYSFL